MREHVELVVGTHADISAADGDLAAVARVHDAHGDDAVDVALIARKTDGAERIYRHVAGGTDGSEEARIHENLAWGFALALFPLILVEAEPEAAAASEPIAADVAKGLGRAGVASLREHLDTPNVALIAAAPPHLRGSVCAAMANADSILTKPTSVDRMAVRASVAAAAGAAQNADARRDH